MTGVLGGPASTIASPTFLLTMQSELIPEVGSSVDLGTPLSTSSLTDGDERPVLVDRSAPYDLRQKVTITLAAGQNLTFTANTFVTAVPEPSTIVVAGIGAVLGLGSLRRRTRA